MSLNATNIEPWMYDDIDTSLILEKRVSGATTTLYKSNHFTLVRRRKFYGLRSFREDTGEVTSYFDLETSPNTNFRYFSTAAKWICSKDQAKVLDFITGDGEQIQIWEHVTEPQATNWSTLLA